MGNTLQTEINQFINATCGLYWLMKMNAGAVLGEREAFCVASMRYWSIRLSLRRNHRPSDSQAVARAPR